MNTSDFKDWKGNKERIFCLNDQKYYIEIQKKNILRNPYAILVEGGGGWRSYTSIKYFMFDVLLS